MLKEKKYFLFDIDGTLVPWKSGRIPASVFESVAALRRKGILCFVATGRSPFEISAGHLIDGLDVDGYLLNNGELGVDADGTVFYRCPVDPDDLARLLDWVEARGLSCWMVSEKQCAINRLTPAAAQALEDIRTQPPKLGDLRALCREPVYKFSLFLPPEELPMELLPHCAKTQWHAFGHDLFSAAGGKQQAFAATLARYGLTPAQCMAFGDSDNDIGLLTAGRTARGRLRILSLAIARRTASVMRWNIFLYCNQHFGSGHGRVFTSAALLHRRKRIARGPRWDPLVLFTEANLKSCTTEAEKRLCI